MGFPPMLLCDYFGSYLEYRLYVRDQQGWGMVVAMLLNAVVLATVAPTNCLLLSSLLLLAAAAKMYRETDRLSYERGLHRWHVASALYGSGNHHDTEVRIVEESDIDSRRRANRLKREFTRYVWIKTSPFVSVINLEKLIDDSGQQLSSVVVG